MAFERLLWSCLDHGTSISEEGLALSVPRQADETVLLFRTDTKAFRAAFFPGENQHISCDALFFYKYGERPPVLVFVELKGANLPHALAQLTETIKAVKPSLPAHAELRALVVTDGAGPTTRMAHQKRFEADVRVNLHIEPTVRGKKPMDLRAVLRKHAPEFVGP